MTTIEQIRSIESQMLALKDIMAKSDAHASRCIKLGLSFEETYPDDVPVYQAANKSYNDLEVKLVSLREQLAKELAEQPHDVINHEATV